MIWKLGLLITIFSSSADAILTRQMAFDLLKKKSLRWHQTEQIQKEAAGQVMQAKSASKFRAEIVSREYFARMNTIQFGFPDSGPLDIVSLGETLFQGNYKLRDKASDFRLEAAQENEKMSVETQKVKQSELIFLMLLTYLNVQRLDQKRQTVSASILRDKEMIKIAKTRMKSGTGIQLDFLKAGSLLKKDELKQLDLNQNFNRARQDLQLVLGVDQLDTALEPLEFKPIKENILQKNGEVEASVKQRPDVKNAKALVAVTEKLKDQAQNEDSWRLGLMGGVGLVGSYVLGGKNSAVTGTIGIQFTLPVFDGGYAEGRVQEMSAKNSTAQSQAQIVEMEARSQIKSALSQIDEAKSTWESAVSYQDVAHEEQKLVLKKFKMGAASGLELSNIHTNSALAEETQIDALFGYEFAKLNYFRAIGNLEQYIYKESGP